LLPHGTVLLLTGRIEYIE
jgi:hypothetical protein